jgi:hypothetical protein
VPIVGTEVIAQFLRAVEAKGGGDDGTQAVARILEGLAGAEARGSGPGH